MHQPLKHHIFEDSSMVVTSSSTWSAGGITLNFRKKKIISHRIADDNIKLNSSTEKFDTFFHTY